MLFEIITVILAIYAVLTPIWIMKSVKFGIKCAEKPAEAAEEPVFTLPEKKKDVKVPEEMQKTLDILENIEVYDGTSNGQKEIK